jgi:hypothetical protein
MPGLLERYGRTILKCEELGIRYADHAYELWDDPDFTWLIHTEVTLHGAPSDDVEGRPVWVSEGGIGGWVDEELSEFPQAIAAVLATDSILRRIDKLTKSGHDEQHLFVLADQSALPASVAMGMITSSMPQPPGEPPLPASVTHLWLMVRFSPYLLLGTADGWTTCSHEQLA